jgi:hypothetical protein
MTWIPPEIKSEKPAKWTPPEVEKKTPGATSISIPEKSRIAFVHNNPGNLMYAKQPGATKGESRGKGNWAKFNTPEEGFNALVDQVKLDQSRDLTVSEFMNKYAPPSENDTGSYIESFSNELGVKSTDKISSSDPLSIAKFLAQRESNTEVGDTAPITPEVKPTEVPASEEQPRKIGGIEFQGRSLLNTLVGSTALFLSKFPAPTQYGGRTVRTRSLSERPIPLSQASREWRESKQENQMLLDTYDPNMAEDVLAFTLGVAVDLPVFGGFGSAGTLTAKSVAKAGQAGVNQLVRTGMSKEAANKILYGSLTRVADGLAKRSASSAAALGGHAALMDVTNQLAEGKSIDEVDYGQTLKTGGKSSLLGAGVGVIGYGTTAASRASSKLLDSGKHWQRWAAEKGIQTTGLQAEVGAFQYGGKLLDEDETPVTMKDWLKMNAEFLTLKLGGVKGFAKDPKSKRYPEDISRTIRELDITPEELRAAGVGSAAELGARAVEGTFANDMIASKDIPGTLKVKIMSAMNPEMAQLPDLTKSAESVILNKDGDRIYLETKDADGNLLEIKDFRTEAEAESAKLNIVEQLKNNSMLENYDKLSVEGAEKEWSTVNSDIKKQFGQTFSEFEQENLMAKPFSERSQDAQKKIDRVAEIVNTQADKFRERKIKDTEEKLTETEKKKAEEEKKLTEKKGKRLNRAIYGTLKKIENLKK